MVHVCKKSFTEIAVLSGRETRKHTSLEITFAVITSHTSESAMKSPNDDILSAPIKNTKRARDLYVSEIKTIET